MQKVLVDIIFLSKELKRARILYSNVCIFNKNILAYSCKVSWKGHFNSNGFDIFCFCLFCL